ncbi:DNA polymerase epsilon subunit 4 [Ceratina calcarata]|uniref:DNA polymerase epsilon subunit 4 n=1 Tax=Ceratina calcarata TaxID=156304 RepID=A0AAJ7IZA3_9HYME|nr:DNA polymerase epsilon subunit 4 [Ceratina calcarata]
MKMENEENRIDDVESHEGVGEDAQEEDSLQEETEGNAEEQKEKLLRFPLGRIKSLIKMDPEVNMVNQEAVFLISKAAELFIDSLVKESYKYTAQMKKKLIQKRDIANAIDNVDSLVFLEGMLD